MELAGDLIGETDEHGEPIVGDTLLIRDDPGGRVTSPVTLASVFAGLVFTWRTPVVLGSIEYAVEHLGSPLIVVLGHTKCGAVKAAVGRMVRIASASPGGEKAGNSAMVAPTASAMFMSVS